MNIFKNKWLSSVLIPVSWLYGSITELRNLFYDRGWLHSESILDCKVISIGNISVGGTGKTPAVAAIARVLQESGKRVAILSRGYGRKTTGTIVVSDGHHIQVSPELGGDEPYLLAKKLTGVPVVVEPDRIKGARFLYANFHPDIILLDDAFQHRRIKRDIDIVLIDSSIPIHLYHHLPAGILREHWRHLKRATMIWLTRVNQAEQLAILIEKIKQSTNAPIIRTMHTPVALRTLTDDEIPLEQIKEKRVFLFSGIGNPQSFKRAIQSLNAQIVGEKRFRDHYSYKASDIETIKNLSHQCQANCCITTEKDAIKLIRITKPDYPLYYLSIELTTEFPLPSLLEV
jgi:tetraacyldisaccharide 4'-kinase